VKTISVRDLRQKWPAAEAALAVEKRIIITRDGEPVAQLMPFKGQKRRRKRFDPAQHRERMRQLWGETRVRFVDEFLTRERKSD
jgi:antitoxin (DNA-binding transcriptional repressor) of toxin-antitoxin stability system